MQKNIRALIGALALGVCVAAPAQPAADYPTQPVKVIITFPPGGSTDAVIRMLTPRLNERLGQPVLVENRPGAGGNVGLGLLAKAAPDGYVVGVGAAGALSANASLYANMPFEVARDFRPVAMLAAIPFVVVGRPGLSAKTIGELIALAKSQPGKLSLGHGGNGTAMHLSTALLSQMAGVKFNEIPYKGSGPAAVDAMGGQVDVAIVDLPASLQQIRAGKLIAYAVTSPQRLQQLPDTPTLSESGLRGYDSTGWFGVVAPASVPAAVIRRLNAAINEGLTDPVLQTSMRNLGVEPVPGTPEAFGAYIGSETTKWAQVIKQGNIKIDQ